MITTVCYLEKDNKYLMLHRTKKKNDIHKNKWLGIGGKLEKNESPMNCVIREIKEETGLTAWNLDFKGIVSYINTKYDTEYMYVYTCKNFSGEITNNCIEGDLEWIPKDELFNLNIWEGDTIFLSLVKKNSPFFYLTMYYDGYTFKDYKLEFKDDDFTVFEVFVPEDHVDKIVKALGRYDLLTEGSYSDVYAIIDVVGHWTSLVGSNPYDGEVGKHSSSPEKLMKFRVKSDFKELAYKIIKENHPYEVPVINMIPSM